MFRSFLAYLAAPFPIALFQSLVVALWPKSSGSLIYAHPASMFVAVCLTFYLFGAILGVPLLLGLRRIWPGRRAYARAGLLTGLVPGMAILVRTVPHGTISPFGAMYILIFFCLGGYMAGALYWRIAVGDRARAADIRSAFE